MTTSFVLEGIIDYFHRPSADAPARPTEVWAALLFEGSEITGSSYVRINVSDSAGAPSTSDEEATSLTTTRWEWPEATGTPYQADEVRLLDDENAGNVLARHELVDSEGDPAPVTIAVGERAVVEIGAARITARRVQVVPDPES